MVVRAVELIDLVVGQRPTAQGGRPWLRQHLRIVDRDLNHEVIHRRTGVALGDMQFVAMKPPIRHDEGSFVERYRVDYERVAFPSADTVAVKQRLWIFRVWTSVRGYHTEVIQHFVKLHQHSRLVNQHGPIWVLQPDGWNTARHTI